MHALPSACRFGSGTLTVDAHMQTAQDRDRINLEEDYEIRYWTEALGCTEEQLRQAVRDVGASARNVRAFLPKRFASRGRRRTLYR